MASVDSDALEAARLAAIEESGWGRPFKLFQPHNAAFWVYVLIVMAGALSFGRYLSAGLPAYRQALIVAVVFVAIYTVPFWLFIRHNDRYEREPAKLALVGFVWGALAATFALALSANQAILDLYAKAFGQAWVHDWGPALTAPFVEELSKGAGIVLLIVLAPQLVRSAYDGLILGAFVGLGFEVLEDLFYAFNGAAAQFGANQTGEALTILALRGVTGLFSHALYSAHIGMGLVWFLGRPNEPRRRMRGLAFMLAAVLAHGSWDAAAALGRGTVAGSLLVALASAVYGVAVLLIGVRWAATRERIWMRDLMAPELGGRDHAALELDALSGRRKERKAYIKAGKGYRNHRVARHVLHAATDLAEEIARAGGADNDRVLHARAELARVRGS